MALTGAFNAPIICMSSLFYWRLSMDIEQCNCCFVDLEEAQIGRCEDCRQQIDRATWSQQIEAIKLAAERVSRSAVRQVEVSINRGIEHMGYKDHTEFNCSCEEEYIFGEAEHLIDELHLPFRAAIDDVIAQAESVSGESQSLVAGQ